MNHVSYEDKTEIFFLFEVLAFEEFFKAFLPEDLLDKKSFSDFM